MLLASGWLGSALHQKRQGQGKGRAFSRLALYYDRALVRAHHPIDNRQAEAATAALAPGARRIHTVETLEDVCEMFGRNTLAAIAHLDVC